MGENKAAKPEYATAEIAVWWDTKDCPIPEGFDARRIRPSIEAALKKLGYSGPVSITAYGDQNQSPDQLLRELSSSGVDIAHCIPKNTCSKIFSDMLKWRGLNPPPASMMLISDQIEQALSWDLARLQQKTKYNLLRASSFSSVCVSPLVTSAKWVWESLLGSKDSESELSATGAGMFYCKSCSFDCPSLASFRKHLSSSKHVVDRDLIAKLVNSPEI